MHDFYWQISVISKVWWILGISDSLHMHYRHTSSLKTSGSRMVTLRVGLSLCK